MSMEVFETEPNTEEVIPYLEVSGLEFSYDEVKVLHGLEFQLNLSTSTTPKYQVLIF